MKTKFSNCTVKPETWDIAISGGRRSNLYSEGVQNCFSFIFILDIKRQVFLPFMNSPNFVTIFYDKKLRLWLDAVY